MFRTHLFQLIAVHGSLRNRRPRLWLVPQLPGCSTFQNLPPTGNCSKLLINIIVRLMGTTPKLAERYPLRLAYLSLLQ